MTTITRARIVDSRGAREGLFDLVIAGGRFAEIRESAGVSGSGQVDLAGQYVLPSFANLHAHLALDSSPDPFESLSPMGADEVYRAARTRWLSAGRGGIGLIRDVGSAFDVDLRLASEGAAGRITGPRIVGSGPAITIPGGHGARLGVEVAGAGESRRAAEEILRRGARSLKLIATGGIMSPTTPGIPELTVEEMRAAVEVAHRAGHTVAAHAESAEGIYNALEAGVDTIEHGHGLTAELAGRMAAAGTTLVPTLLADVVLANAGADPRISSDIVDRCQAMLPSLLAAFAHAVAAGTPIGAGNDAGTPFVRIEDIARELDLYVQHGLPPLAALASATTTVARLLSLDDWGLIDEGAEANFFAVPVNVLAEGFAAARPTCAMLGGRWVQAPSMALPA